jgi:hypothetical protein
MAMAVAHKIADFDIVELTERVDDAPAGSRGGVLELREGDMAMIEVTKPDLGLAARIVFAPPSKLRLVEPARQR